MRTTNVLLGIIILILLLNLMKSSESFLFQTASAQKLTKRDSVSQIIDVRIVDVSSGTFSGSMPVIYGSSFWGFVPPQTIGSFGSERKVIPVVVHPR